MKFIISTEKLLKALRWIRPVIPIKSSLPAATVVQVHASGSEIVLAATNLETSARTKFRLQSPIAQPLSFGVNPKFLEATLTSIATKAVEIDVPDEIRNIQIGGGNITAKLTATDSKDLPPIPTIIPNKQLPPIRFPNFASSLNQVVFAAAHEASRPVLAAVCIAKENQGKVALIAADGLRMAIYPVNIRVKRSQVLIPRKSVEILQKLFRDAPTVTYLEPDEKNLMHFYTKDTEVSVSAIVGTFPDHAKLIPTEYTKAATFETKDLLKALTRLEPIAKDAGNNMVKLFFSKKNLVISVSGSEDLDKLSAIIPAHGSEGHIAFHIPYLKEALNKLGERCCMKFEEPSQPGLFQNLDKDAFTFHVIMPMFVQW